MQGGGTGETVGTVFRRMDADSSGYLDHTELGNALRDLALQIDNVPGADAVLSKYGAHVDVKAFRLLVKEIKALVSPALAAPVPLALLPTTVARAALPPLPAVAGTLPPVTGALAARAPVTVRSQPPLPAPTTPPPPPRAVEKKAGGATIDHHDEGYEDRTSVFNFHSGGPAARAFFAPKGTRVDRKVMASLSKLWGLRPPAAVLSFDAGAEHPSRFASAALVQTDQFAAAWASTLEQAQSNELALRVTSDVLFLKLKMSVAALLDLAQMSNHWILVDRVNHPSPAAEVLIEAALCMTVARPTILVIDSFERLDALREEPSASDGRTDACQDTLRQIRRAGVVPGALTGTVRPFYDPIEFIELREPSGRGDAVVWSDRYLATMFASGTHYLVLDEAGSAPPLDAICQRGAHVLIAANGQESTRSRLKESIIGDGKVVLLHNTGGATQAYASLRNAIVAASPPSYGASEAFVPKLMRKLERVAPCADDFGLPEIMMLQELHRRAPDMLAEWCVSVDMLDGELEDMIVRVRQCLKAAEADPFEARRAAMRQRARQVEQAAMEQLEEQLGEMGRASPRIFSRGGRRQASKQGEPRVRVCCGSCCTEYWSTQPYCAECGLPTSEAFRQNRRGEWLRPCDKRESRMCAVS